MFCKNCGNTLNSDDKVCGKCGAVVATTNPSDSCPYCGATTRPGNAFCTNCGAKLGGEAPARTCKSCGTELKEGNAFCTNCGASADFTPTMTNPVTLERSTRSRLAAGLLGIFLGGYGVHNFYLGKHGVGVAQILVTLFTCGIGGIWGFVEGIVILCSKDPKDAEGKILCD